MHCDKCGFENPEGMRFCGQCAAPLKLVCPSCGFANPPGFGFCGQCATPLGKATEPGTEQKSVSAQEPAAQEAERRQLTVLFCDIVGSSAISEQLDPEELRDIMRDYRETCSEIIHRHSGYVAQYLGDGILVYFGYPHAHEDDAQRAARAALELTQQIPRLIYRVQQGDDIQLAVRVGVHTGLVVIGEIGGGDKRTLALGETPNIAARIQDYADSNSVVISEVTHRLLGERFDCASLGEHQLKGFTHPLELFKVEQLRQPQNRSTATRSTQRQPPLIGREQESELLLERLEQARKGVGQMVLLSGEPGLGKTRMVQMLCDKVAQHSCIVLECAGSTYYQNSFLFPIMAMLRRALGLNETANPDDNLARIEQTVATLGMDANNTVPILAELLSVPVNGRYPTKLESTPQQKKQQTLDTLVRVLQTMAQQRFVLLVVEDLQWVDPSTLELLGLLANQPGLTNIFALLTFRNEFSPPWPPRVNLTQITLNRLTRQQSGSMIRQLCKGKTLPMEVFAELINKTDGIPFFVEELTNTVLRSKLLVEQAEHYELNSPMAQLGIPTTLQDSLMSRLDSLGEDKELAQLSAILGREFGHELLSVVSSRDENSLRSGLDRLINAELFFQRGQPPKAWYSFRHALLREAAYQSLLKRTRQQYHQRIAGLLQEHFPHTVADNPELLAHHSTEGGDFETALQYWLAAGHHAIQRSANLEAIAHLNNGLSLLEQLPDAAEWRATELALQTALGLAVMMSKGYAAPEVERAYARARSLCHDMDDIHAVFPVLCGLWEYYIVRADLDSALALARELHQLALQAEDNNLAIEAQRVLGTTQFWQGHLMEALQQLASQDHLAHDGNKAAPLLTLASYCQDARVAALSNAGCVLWLLGQPDQALDRAHQALDLAKRLAHPFSQAYALHFLSTVHQLRGDRQATAQYAEAQIALSETYGFAFWAATGRMLLAWARADDIPPENTLADFQQALDDYEASGNQLARSYFLALFAELHQQADQIDAALAITDKALQETTVTHEGFFVAELLRLKGELTLAAGDSQNAEILLSAALDQAQQQGAKSLSLRVAISLARLWQNQGNIAMIPALLKEQLNEMGEGNKTADVMLAQRLLANANIAAMRH
jgi:predicted ATPase/class 3 adenylate cyclase